MFWGKIDPVFRFVYYIYIYLFVTLQPNSGLGCLIVQISRSRTIRNTPLNEWSASPRGRYLLKTTRTQQAKIQAFNVFFFLFVHSFLSFVLSFLFILYLYILCSHVILLQHTTQTSMAPRGIRTHNPSNRVASELRLTIARTPASDLRPAIA